MTMETKVLNGEWQVPVPDGFRELGSGEIARMNTVGEAPQWCAQDEARHIIVSAAWKKSGFAALMLSSKEVAQKMEASLRKAMQPYGYRPEGFVTADVGGLTADGFRYSYTAQGIGMSGESLSLKKGKTFYYLHCYCRTALAEESLSVIEEMLASSAWL